VAGVFWSGRVVVLDAATGRMAVAGFRVKCVGVRHRHCLLSLLAPANV
jgi:hypothetical protein